MALIQSSPIPCCPWWIMIDLVIQYYLSNDWSKDVHVMQLCHKAKGIVDGSEFFPEQKWQMLRLERYFSSKALALHVVDQGLLCSTLYRPHNHVKSDPWRARMIVHWVRFLPCTVLTLVLSPNIPYGPLSWPGMNTKYRARSDPWASQSVAPNQIKTKQKKGKKRTLTKETCFLWKLEELHHVGLQKWFYGQHLHSNTRKAIMAPIIFMGDSGNLLVQLLPLSHGRCTRASAARVSDSAFIPSLNSQLILPPEQSNHKVKTICLLNYIIPMPKKRKFHLTVTNLCVYLWRGQRYYQGSPMERELETRTEVKLKVLMHLY